MFSFKLQNPFWRKNAILMCKMTMVTLHYILRVKKVMKQLLVLFSNQQILNPPVSLFKTKGAKRKKIQTQQNIYTY